MLMIAAGYEDCDDVDALRADPALKIAVGRCPETGADLMSQPTLVAAREPCRLACAGPHRARPDRSLLPELRAPAAAHRARHRRHRRSRARPAGARALQRALRLHLLPADPHLRRRLGQAGAVAAAARQAALGRGGGQGPAPRHRPHPQALAQRRDPGARRQPLLQRARTGAAGSHALRLHHRLRHQLQAAGDRGTLARAMRHAPLAG